MTETLTRPASTAPGDDRPEGADRRRLVGLRAGLRAASAGLLVVLLVGLILWVAEARSGSSVPEALRGLGQLWLLAHGATLDVPDGQLSLAPLGLCLLPLAALRRSGSIAARECGADTVRAALSLALRAAVPYTLVVAVAAVLTRTDDVRAPLLQATLAGFVLAALGLSAGTLRAAGLGSQLWERLGRGSRDLLRALGLSTLWLLAAGAGLAGLSLLLHLNQAIDLAGATDAGAVGGLGLLTLGLALVPNAVVYGAAWLSGPGFAVGVGTSVGPYGVELGPVPALPLLGALPSGGVPTWVGVAVLLVPLAGGWLAGRVLASGHDPAGSAASLVLQVLSLGLLTASTWLVLGWLAGGAAGGARLSGVGPSPWQLALAVAGEVTVGALLGGLLARRSRRHAPREQQPAASS